MLNKYYTALEPFEVLRAVGTKPSNTYIGRSQVIDTVYETTTVNPGEELHDLVGGLFHVDGENRPHEIRLTKPPHIFEAKYHTGAEAARMSELVRDEFLAEEDDPRNVENYRNK